TNPGIGDISQDPQYQNASNKDFRLQYTSPCINAGDPDSQYNDPDSTRNDMGALYCDTPPSVPTGLSAIAGYSQVTLTWNKNTEPDIQGYTIYGGTSSNPTTQIDSINSASDTSTIITGLPFNVVHYFRIKAFDKRLNKSDYSAEVSATPIPTPLQVDSLALIALYDSTNGNGWTNNTNWKTTNRVSSWYGITVENGRVTEINLGSNNLFGTIPSNIGDIDSLNILYLYGNQLSDSIPYEIGNLLNLEYLRLGSNQLIGPIPSEIGNLINLTELRLSNNQLSGKIPQEIYNLTYLTYLILGGNQFVDTIPDIIGNLNNLQYLNISYNNFTGSIPSEIGNLSNLLGLYFHSNQLTGTIPAEIGNLNALQCLMIQDNQLSGQIPSAIGNLNYLELLSIENNQFSDSIPSSIRNLVNLTSISLYNNKLTDLPDLTTISGLHTLLIQNNQFTFEDIEPNIGAASTTFTYSPQDSVGVKIDTSIQVDSSYTLSIFVGGDNNQYQWYKNGIEITGATDTFYTINPVEFSDSGSYTCEITNTVATALTLYSRPVNMTVIDTIPPSSPQNPTATAGNGQVLLQWQANTENDLSKYYIYQGIISPANSLIDSVTVQSPSDTFFIDILANACQIFYYRISAVDSFGNESVYSNEVSATPQPIVAPTQNKLNVPKDTVISVSFGIDMNPDSLNSNTFIVYASQTGLHTGTYSYNSGTQTATFNPHNDFVVGEIVIVILTTDIYTLEGDSLLNPYQWSFTIETKGGSGLFKPKIEYTAAESGCKYVIFSDLDNDGDMDLTMTNYNSNNISVLFNNGDGTFHPYIDYATGDEPRSVFSSDLDGDGNMDLAIANSSSNNISILINDGNGSFITKTDYISGNGPHSIFSSDLDSDGDIDLSVANYISNTISVFLNNGNGIFQTKTDYATGGQPRSIISSDLDNDGDMDLAVAKSVTDNVSVLLNNGNGLFGPKTDYTAGSSPWSVFSSDLNGDGNMDLAVANSTSSNVSVLLGNGDGTFDGKIDYTVGSSPRYVFSSDLNGDGYLDLMLTNQTSHSISALLNNGDGTFQPKIDYLMDDDLWSLYPSDLDGDGDMDLAVGNYYYYTDYISILLNRNKKTDITLSLDTINFGNVDKDSTKNIQFIIYNYGIDSTLNISNIISSSSVFVLNTTSASILPEDSLLINISFSPSCCNSYNDSLTIYSNDPNKPQVKIYISGECIDTVPPSPPQNFTATKGDEQIILQWSLNSETDLDKYNIFRDGILHDSIIATGFDDTLYTDSNLTNYQTYEYYITAVDSSGNESQPSDTVSVFP
ncbi:MAG: VCBS repeat-containing protein, partial [Bacteroidales bacterium]|nr:VCBS repeat-containing protein [Bacteroidales bacterium]